VKGALVAISLLAVALAACTSEPPTTLDPSGGAGASGNGAGNGAGSGTPGSTGSGPDAQAARDYFEQNVSPIMDADAVGNACATCHASQFGTYPGAPFFMGGAKGEYYDQIVANPLYVNAAPGKSKLLTQGLHEGPALKADEAEKVTTWLEMEAAIRFPGSASGAGGGGSADNATGLEMLEKFGDVMTLDVWLQTGMPEIASQPTVGKPCYGCHAKGMSANYMAFPPDQAAVAEAFEHMRYPTPLTKLVTYEVDATTGQATKLVQAYRWRDKGKPPTAHPKYILDPVYEEYMDSWFAITMAACGEPCGAEPGGVGGGGGGGGLGGGGGAGGGQ